MITIMIIVTTTDACSVKRNIPVKRVYRQRKNTDERSINNVPAKVVHRQKE